MKTLVQTLLEGTASGALYALLAFGLVIVYRTSTVINFAHGGVAMLAVHVAFVLSERGWPLAVALGIGLVTALGLGIGSQRIVARAEPGGHYAQILATIALFLVADGVANLAFGATPTPFLRPLADLPSLELPQDILLSGIDTLRIVTTASLLLGLGLYLRRSRFGLTLRAVAESRVRAARLGIAVDRVQARGWALGAGLAAVAVGFLGLQAR